MRKIRIGVGVCLALAMALGISGCSPTSPSTGAKGSESGTITWWVPSPTAQKNTLQDAAARFTKQTGIKVNVEAFPWANYLTKLTTAVTGGNGPDVAEIGNTWAAALATGFHPWTESDLKVIGGKSQIFSNVMGVSGVPGGPTTSIPFTAQSWVMQYNKKMFSDAGIDAPPATWDQFVADAKRLTHADQGVYGAAIPLGAPSAVGTFGWVIVTQNGGALMTKDGKTATFTGDGTVAAVTQAMQWVGVDGIMSPAMATDTTGTQADADFANGKAAMEITQNVQSALKDPTKTGIALVPLQSADAKGNRTIMSHVAGENLAIFKSSTHQSEAIQFVKFLLSAPEQIQLNKELFQLPVTKEAGQDPYFQTANQKAYLDILANHAQPMPSAGNANAFITNFQDAFVKLFRDAASSHHVDEAQVVSALKQAEATANAAASAGK